MLFYRVSHQGENGEPAREWFARNDVARDRVARLKRHARTFKGSLRRNMLASIVLEKVPIPTTKRSGMAEWLNANVP